VPASVSRKFEGFSKFNLNSTGEGAFWLQLEGGDERERLGL